MNTISSTDEHALLEAVHDAVDVITSASHTIENVADLLHQVGMEKLANRLYEVCDPMVVAVKTVRDAYGDDLSEQVKNSQQMTGNILMALVHGVIQPPTAHEGSEQ